jgi:Zn-dependent protease with chaperone function
VHLKNRQVTLFLLLTQGIGAVFVGVFSAAYLLALPSDEVLHSEPVFSLSLQITGALFLILVLVSVVLSFKVKSKG